MPHELSSFYLEQLLPPQSILHAAVECSFTNVNIISSSLLKIIPVAPKRLRDEMYVLTMSINLIMTWFLTIPSLVHHFMIHILLSSHTNSTSLKINKCNHKLSIQKLNSCFSLCLVSPKISSLPYPLQSMSLFICSCVSYIQFECIYC